MSLPLNIDFGQILIHMFNLALLFGGLYLLLYKPVKKFMDNRTAEYKAIEDETDEKLRIAEEAQKQAEEKLAGAEMEIARKAEQAKRDAEQEAEDIIKDAQKIKKQIIADAEDAATREKTRMINDAREELAELAVKAAEKVLSEKAAVSEDNDA